MKAIVFAAVVLAAPLQAFADQPPPAAAEPSEPSVDEITVLPHAACMEPKRDPLTPSPHVVSTFPADGAVVRPGVLYLRVTFDEPMSCKGFFTAMRRMRSPCDRERQVWLLSYDRKTIHTLCHTEPNNVYGVRISRDLPDSEFISLAGHTLDPYEFSFTTNLGPEVTTARDSLAQDTEMYPPSPGEPIPLQEFRGKR